MTNSHQDNLQTFHTLPALGPLPDLHVCEQEEAEDDDFEVEAEPTFLNSIARQMVQKEHDMMKGVGKQFWPDGIDSEEEEDKQFDKVWSCTFKDCIPGNTEAIKSQMDQLLVGCHDDIQADDEVDELADLSHLNDFLQDIQTLQTELDTHGDVVQSDWQQEMSGDKLCQGKTLQVEQPSSSSEPLMNVTTTTPPPPPASHHRSQGREEEEEEDTYKDTRIGINQPVVAIQPPLEQRLRSMGSLLKTLKQDQLTAMTNPGTKTFDADFASSYYEYRVQMQLPMASTLLKKQCKQNTLPASSLSAEQHKFLLAYSNQAAPQEEQLYHQQLIKKARAEQQRYYYYMYSLISLNQNLFDVFSDSIQQLAMLQFEEKLVTVLSTYARYFQVECTFKFPYKHAQILLQEEKLKIEFEVKGMVRQQGDVGVWEEDMHEAQIDLKSSISKPKRLVVREDQIIWKLIATHSPDVVVQSSAMVAFMTSPPPYFPNQWLIPCKITKVANKNIIMLDKPVLKEQVTKREVHQKIFKKLLHTQYAQGCRKDSYHLWNIGGMSMLVRSSDLLKSNKSQQELVLQTKMEYLLNYSLLEDFTVEELLKWWTSCTLRPGRCLRAARIDIRNYTVVGIEDRYNPQSLFDKIRPRLDVRVALYCFSEMLKKVSELPPGEYLLGHPAKTGELLCFKACHNQAVVPETTTHSLDSFQHSTSHKVFDLHEMQKKSNKFSNKCQYVPPLWKQHSKDIPQVPHTFVPKCELGTSVNKVHIQQNPKTLLRPLEDNQQTKQFSQQDIDYGDL